MKSNIRMLLLAALLGVSLTACGSGAAQSVTETEPAAESEAVSLEAEEVPDEEEELGIEVPGAVENISEEDDILMNGELKDGVYSNQYFGFRFIVPEGGTLVRDNDDAAESKEIIPLRQAYEDGWGGLSFTATMDEPDGFINIFISALDNDEIGMSEEELVKKRIKEIWDVNQFLGEEDGPAYETAMLAGEEHPVSLEVTETDDGERLSAEFCIPKGDFEYHILVSVLDAKLEDAARLFEKF